MPPGLPEYALIIGGLFVAMLVGFVTAALLCASGSDACSGQVCEDLATGQLHDWWGNDDLPGPVSGPWPCPNETPCPIHPEQRTR